MIIIQDYLQLFELWYQDNNLFFWVSVGLVVCAVWLFYYSARCDHDDE